ncbi:MAG: hypothetical protein JW874_09735 [Spirochaetales bacterium]|nr:hypothetical protein [Spirochaetales bacterium]
MICSTILQQIREFAVISLLSFLVGCAVAFPFILINGALLVTEILKAGITGLSIGIVSRFVFALVFRFIHSNPFWAFFALFFVIGPGTLAGAWFLELRDPLQLGIIIFVSEAVGISLSIFLYRYSNRLNNSLRTKQKMIESEQNDTTG